MCLQRCWLTVFCLEHFFEDVIRQSYIVVIEFVLYDATCVWSCACNIAHCCVKRVSKHKSTRWYGFSNVSSQMWWSFIRNESNNTNYSKNNVILVSRTKSLSLFVYIYIYTYIKTYTYVHMCHLYLFRRCLYIHVVYIYVYMTLYIYIYSMYIHAYGWLGHFACAQCLLNCRSLESNSIVRGTLSACSWGFSLQLPEYWSRSGDSLADSS